MATALRISTARVFGVFSLALVISAALGPFVGRCIDRRGGRDMLVASNLVLFGSRGFGRRQGLIIAPARIAQAGAPLAFGLLLEAFGSGALWLTSGLMLAALPALLAIRRPA